MPAMDPSCLLNEAEVKEVINMVASKDTVSELVQLVGTKAQNVIDKLGRAVQLCPEERDRHRIAYTLGRMCRKNAMVPESLVIQESLPILKTAVYAGSFGVVHRGRYKEGDVAVKTPRVFGTDIQATMKARLCKEAAIWRCLRHDNVMKIIGVIYTLDNPGLPAFVSPWQRNGSINVYLHNNPKGNRVQLLYGTAQGLEHLHNFKIIHGDLKTANILVNDEGRACLTDFGLTSVLAEHDGLIATTMVDAKDFIKGTHGMIAPEVLEGSVRISKESDIFSLAMVGYEIFSGKGPFPSMVPTARDHQISSKNRPDRPHDAQKWGLSDGLWKLIVECWDQNPGSRPTIKDIVGRIGPYSTDFKPGDQYPEIVDKAAELPITEDPDAEDLWSDSE